MIMMSESKISELYQELSDVYKRLAEKERKTPCTYCRFKNDKSGLCDMCPAMPPYIE